VLVVRVKTENRQCFGDDEGCGGEGEGGGGGGGGFFVLGFFLV
jgi:hypothetical protein